MCSVGHGQTYQSKRESIDGLILAYYKNEPDNEGRKFWWLSGSTSTSASIPSGAQITIDGDGQGSGTTSIGASVSGGGALLIGHGLRTPTEPPTVFLTDSEQGYDTLSVKNFDGSEPAHLDLGDLTAHGSIKIGDGTIYWQTATTPDVLEMDCGLIIDGALNAAGASINGAMGITGQITSTLSTGTAPINVTSTTMCPNLNADKLDGYDATAFLQTSNQYITQVTSPLQVVSHTLSIPQATTSQNGYLSSTDWNTFNNKYGSGSTPTFNGISMNGNIIPTVAGSPSAGYYCGSSNYPWKMVDTYYLYANTINALSGSTISVPTTLNITSHPIWFTSSWEGHPDGDSSAAEISNDTSSYRTLMIVGNKSAGGSRQVGIWDYLTVNGSQTVTGNLSVSGQSSANNLWITGSWLNSSSTLYIGGASNAPVTMYMNGNVNPVGDGAYGLGSGSNRWAGISAINGYFSALSISGNSEINWSTYASSNWTNLGGFRFNNTYNNLGIEFKAMTLDFGNGVLYPVMEMLYLHDGTWSGMFRFDMNGDFRYAGSLIAFDYIDDLAALRAIRSKTTDTGTLIHDPATLKFLQDDKGLYSLTACIGWEISMQQKFLAKHDEHEANIVNLLKRIEALESQLNQKRTAA